MRLIEAYLKTCRELVRFCSQNGWIDVDSLRFFIVREFGNELIVDIEFDELTQQRTGLTTRIPCRGQLHLFTDPYGHVTRAQAL